MDPDVEAAYRCPVDALVIIDLQEASFANARYHDQQGVLTRINQLSAHVRSRGGAVIFIQHDGTEAEGLRPYTAGWRILSFMERVEGDLIVRKTTNDAFCGTTLDHELERLAVNRLIICGWATDFCVDSTVRAAVSRGHKVAVASDCHTVADRPGISAADVVAYHNWLWPNLLTPNGPVTVFPLVSLLDGA
jgi:nicotinamidase-related amidase